MTRHLSKTILSGIFFLTVLSLSWGQQPVLSLHAPSTVYAGQAFEISYSINVSGSKSFKAPAFKGLDILYGPMQSQSSSIQFINGKRSQSFSLSYTYQLRAPQEGNFDFGKASIVVDGTTYYSEPFSLKVTASPDPAPQGQTGRSSSDPRSRPSESEEWKPAEIDGSDLFVSAHVNKRTPYVGEQILLNYRIYTSIPVDQFSIYKTPSNKGFWIEELKINPQEQNQEVIDGKTFVYADIRKVALFAQEAGKHTLDPIEVEALAQVPSQQRRRRSNSIFDIFDDAFFTPMETVKKTLRSKSIQINAKPLPEEGKPASFDGLVGNFQIAFDYDKGQEYKTNEAITFRFTVSGSGNIEMIHPPRIQFPPDFEVYEPKITHDKSVSASGVTGKATFEYIVIPRNPGVYKINAFEYSFFDPKAEKYVTTTLPEMVLKIEKGSGAGSAESASPASGFQLLSNDIEYIRTETPKWMPQGKTFLFSPLFWSCITAELLLLAVFLFVYRKRLERNADLAGMKNRRASKEAKRCLKKAASFMKENKNDPFYIEISQALWGFLSNKLNIPPAELSMDTVREELLKRKISPELTEQFLSTLEHCEFERFSPQGGTARGMQAIYDEALDVIYKIIAALR